MRRSFPAAPAALGEMRRFVGESLRGSLAQSARDELNLAVSEAAANSILHSGAKQVEVEVAVRSDAVEVGIRDDGIFRPDLGKGSGFGLRIMAATVDQLWISHGTDRRPGTEVRLVKRTA